MDIKKRTCFNCVDARLNDTKKINGETHFRCAARNKYTKKVEWNCCYLHDFDKGAS